MGCQTVTKAIPNQRKKEKENQYSINHVNPCAGDKAKFEAALWFPADYFYVPLSFLADDVDVEALIWFLFGFGEFPRMAWYPNYTDGTLRKQKISKKIT